MGSLLFLYFLHPFKSRLTNKTQRFNPRYELTNPTISPPPPFVFSLFSIILRHLHYTLQSLSTLFIISFSLCYYPPSSCYPVSSYPVSPLLIPCYYSCSHVTLSPSTLLLFLCSFVTLSSFYPVSSLCRVKNVYLSYPQGPLLCPRQGLSSMQNMPFLPLEEALLAPWTCPSWRHVFKSLIIRRLW